MKITINRIISTLSVVALGLAFHACSIDTVPLNDVTHDNYWTNKDEVESVVTACYGAMHSEEVIERLIAWGESRSDNTAVGNVVNSNLQFLMKGSVKTTNSYCDWGPLYKVINYCNVLQFEAPFVKSKDPNYTDSDFGINMAETSFIRAYMYLTLIKTFRDVPFTFDASIDDTQNYRLPQTKFETVLDTLIADIELRKNLAPKRYADQALNTGRVTRAAMYSLLAELYLWRASDHNLSTTQQNEYYRKCIACCDQVLDLKAEFYDANNIDGMDLRSMIDQEVYREYGYPLLAEETVVGVNTSGPAAYNDIFGNGASYETIFELAYNYHSTHDDNKGLYKMYGSNFNELLMKASEKVMESAPSATQYDLAANKLFQVPSDYRCLTSFYFDSDGGASYILKYVSAPSLAGASGFTGMGRVGTSFTAPTSATRFIGGQTANWILYRMTEIMLFRAEAEIELAGNLSNGAVEPEAGEDNGDEPTDDVDDGEDDEDDEPSAIRRRKAATVLTDGSSLATSDELLEDAYELISAVYRRSNPAVKTMPTLAPSKPTTYDLYHRLLMQERRREFLFEGKRYFDLVRSARRVGNTRELREALSAKYGDAGQAVTIKLYQMGFMYMPVFRQELKLNPNLQQNECYLDELENTKN